MREVYAHKDIGLINITELLRVFPSGKGFGMARLDVQGFMDAQGEHEYDEVRLNRLRETELGLYNPFLVVTRKDEKQKIIILDIIDGWHRLQVLHEKGIKDFVAFVSPLEMITPFLCSPDHFSASEEIKSFLARKA